VGFRSTGLHSNGYSLVRRTVVPDGEGLDRFVPELGRTLGEELLEPTAIYVEPVLALARAGLVRAAAHVTGGGVYENVPRAIGGGLGAEILVGAWTPHPIFGLLASAAGLDPGELLGVVNGGLGMVVVVPRDRQDQAVAVAGDAGADSMVVGWVSDEPGVRLRWP